MAYTISNTDGSTLVLLADNTIDENSTSLTLIGRNVNGFGQYLNNNFVRLTANFASDSINPPRSPLKGQLWYDTTVKKIKVYDNGFKSISGAVIANTLPDSLTTGDLWFDSTNNQLKIINENSTLIIGPAYPLSVGENGWVLPDTPIKDSLLFSKKVSLLKNYGSVVGAISNELFNVFSTDATKYFSTNTMSLVSGLKIIGDINYTGKINDNYHTLSVDLDFITSATNNIVDLTHVTSQTNVIITMLNAIFPINTQTGYIANPVNTNSIELGVPVGTEAKVICTHTVPFKGYQIRRFRAKVGPTWDYIELSTSNVFTTVSNVVVTVSL